MPISGKVIYWQSVSTAANIDPVRQKQQGLQGTITGMLTGEVVTNVTEAEVDGFVLTFSTGRIAHLAVRDTQGRPALNTQYLRGQGTSGGGLFGGLKNVFSSAGWRRDVAAIRALPSLTKAQRLAITATTKGVFQLWGLNRTAKTLVFEIDAKDELLYSINRTGAEASGHDEDAFNILDFTLFPDKGRKPSSPAVFRLLVLTSLAEGVSSSYSLHDLTIQDGSVSVAVVHPISCYATPYPSDVQWKPQVLLPEPSQTAFVVFDKSIVLMSLVEIEDTPSSQLQKESHILPDPFQDTLDFRRDKSYYVVGCCVEVTDGDSKKASCTILVHGFGMIRVAALPIKEGQSTLERSAITARMKIEQAVFFGHMPQNLLDFSGRAEIHFGEEDIESAALEINDSIMRSTSDYIPAITPSMDHQLTLRSTALAELIKYLVRNKYPLERLTRWKLLWSAEKMAAARAIWQDYNASLGAKDPAKISLLPELLDLLHENHKVENQPDRGETDIVRHYFIHDIWRIELVVPWAQQAVEELYSDGIQDPARQAWLISQADDIQLSALETAFSFRESNAAAYGLGDEPMEDGILQVGYEQLPEIWTSIPEIVTKTKVLADLSREMIINHQDSADEEGEPELSLLIKMAKDNPRLVQICCQAYDERCRWLKSRSDPQSKTDAKALDRAFSEVRKSLIVKLTDLELPDEAMKIAERYRDMQALVDVLAQSSWNTVQRLEQLGLSESEGEELNSRLKSNRGRTREYFTRFGNSWADALYSKYVTQGKLTDLLSNGEGFQGHLTHYLRSKPTYAKLNWINEVTAERNYAAAADSLNAAQKQETRLWSKKIELCIGKLALLAAKEKEQVQSETVKGMIRKADRRVAIIEVQEKLYRYIRPVLRGAIDEMAEADLAIEQLCRRFLKGKPTLRKVMEQTLRKLVARQVLDAEELIDTLTLIDEDVQHSDDEEFADQRFFLALKILRLTGFDKTDPGRKELHEKIIWRRCIIQDDWKLINRTEMKPDTEVAVEAGATALFRTLRAGYKDGNLTRSSYTSWRILTPYITGLFDQLDLVPPTALLTAGTTPSFLRTSTRYANMSDSALRPLAHDLEMEDQALENFLNKARLEMWWKGVVEAAKASVRADADREGSEWLKLEEGKRAVAESMGARDGQTTNGARSGIEAVEKDWQGDVAMM